MQWSARFRLRNLHPWLQDFPPASELRADMKKLILSIFACLAALLVLGVVLPRPAIAAAGDPDLSFGSNGIVRIGFGGGDDYGRAVTVQADGKLVVAGYSGTFPSVFTLVRYNTNDTLDTSFGDGGKVVTQTVPLTNAQVTAIRMQADGRIVAAGWAQRADRDFAVARYNPDGSLDRTFNGTGIIITNLSGSDEALALLIQPDGKILVAGYTQVGGGTRAVIARYQTNGAPDLSWNGTGIVMTNMMGPARALLHMADGKIVAAGGVSGQMGLVRFNANGTVDTAFGVNGRTNVVAGTFSGANAAVIQPAGLIITDPAKILLAGSAQIGGISHFAVARFNLDGSRDTTFGTNGVMATRIGFQHSTAQALLFTGANISRRITLAGYTYGGNEGSIALIRYTLSGVPDTGFNFSGGVLTDIGPGADEAHGMAVYGGRILVAGSSLVNEENHDFALVRYNNDGSRDTNYNRNGIKLEDVGEREAEARAVVLQPDGKLVVAGEAHQGAVQAFALARLNTDGSLDTTFGTGGKVKAIVGTNSSSANAVALQPDGKILVGGFSSEGVALARFHTNGAPDLSFDGDGEVTSTNGLLTSIALQADGRIVAAGSTGIGTERDFLVMRFQTNGAPDTSFDADGRVTTAVANGEDQASQLMLQPDGKIVAAGAAQVNLSYDFALVRYQTNGALDNSFGSFGRVATDFPPTRVDVGIGLAMQTNGRIVLAGYSGSLVNGDIDVALARYLTNGTLDGTFDGDGRVTTPVGFANDLGTSVALQPDGKILVGGGATIGSDATFTVLRYDNGGSLDGSYGAGGKAVIDVGNGNEFRNVALALDAQGRAVLASYIRGGFGVVRLLGDTEFRIVSITRFGDGRVFLRGTAGPNVGITIDTSTTLTPGSFTAAGQTTADGEGQWQFEHATATGTQRFYRASDP